MCKYKRISYVICWDWNGYRVFGECLSRCLRCCWYFGSLLLMLLLLLFSLYHQPYRIFKFSFAFWMAVRMYCAPPTKIDSILRCLDIVCSVWLCIGFHVHTNCLFFFSCPLIVATPLMLNAFDRCFSHSDHTVLYSICYAHSYTRCDIYRLFFSLSGGENLSLLVCPSYANHTNLTCENTVNNFRVQYHTHTHIHMDKKRASARTHKVSDVSRITSDNYSTTGYHSQFAWLYDRNVIHETKIEYRKLQNTRRTFHNLVYLAMLTLYHRIGQPSCLQRNCALIKRCYCGAAGAVVAMMPLKISLIISTQPKHTVNNVLHTRE